MAPVKKTREVSISEFKAHCASVINRVLKTGQPVRITRRGVPVAVVTPVTQPTKPRKLGRMAGTAKILGDIVSPVIDWNEFEAYRD